MKLLVVEDDPTLQQALRRLLEQWGYAVEAASTAAAALAWLEQEHFDLVLLDLGLPDGDGLALCQTLRGWRLHQPLVLMLTARDGSGGGVVTVLAALLVGRRMLRVAVEPLQQQVSVGLVSRCPNSSRCSIASGRGATGGHSGLGLAIARAIARRHGGELRLGESRPGRCVLLVELPIGTTTS